MAGEVGAKYPKLCVWAEANIAETWTFYRLPVAHHKHLKSTNLLERFNQEIKRRTLVVRIFPNEASCLRLVRAVAAEMHEEWMEGSRYLNMEPLREQLALREGMTMAAWGRRGPQPGPRRCAADRDREVGGTGPRRRYPGWGCPPSTPVAP